MLVLDLDGVIRHFDPGAVAAIEERHGLAPGAIHAAAFASDLVTPAVTGGVTRAEWTVAVGERLGAVDAAVEWAGVPAEVDHAVIEIVREVRRRAVTVAVLTNGTSAIDDELVALGIADEFDRVFNSWSIGVAKPDHRVFRHVLVELGRPPAAVTYLDDTLAHVRAARELGIDAHHYDGIDALRRAIDGWPHP